MLCRRPTKLLVGPFYRLAEAPLKGTFVHTWLKSSVIGLALIGLALLVPASALGVNRETVAVAIGAGGQFDPSIKGDSIAYTDTSIAANGADIVVWTISSQSERVRITGNGGAQETGEVDGNFVVYRQWSSTDTDAEIYVYDLTTNSSTQITNDGHLQFDPAISGTTIVWTQVENAGAPSETSTIWAANVNGTNVRPLSPGGNQITAAIHLNTVVWREDNNIVSFDLATTVKTTIAAGVSPDVHGTKIVYASGGNIFLHEAGMTTQLTNEAAGQRNAKVSAILVAWEHVVSGSDVDLHGFDFRTNSTTVLVSGPGLQQLHDLDAANLAFTEYSADAAGDIYLSREVVITPATLVVTPATATNPAGTTHTVTATVTEANGQPVRDVVVRWRVVFEQTSTSPPTETFGECTTNPSGQCTFSYMQIVAGSDVITAFADTDNDGTQDTGEPGGAATKVWTEPTPGCPPNGGDDDKDKDGLEDDDESLFTTVFGMVDSDGDGITDGNDDADHDGRNDEDEDDGTGDECPNDSDGDGTDDEDEDD